MRINLRRIPFLVTVVSWPLLLVPLPAGAAEVLPLSMQTVTEFGYVGQLIDPSITDGQYVDDLQA